LRPALALSFSAANFLDYWFLNVCARFPLLSASKIGYAGKQGGYSNEVIFFYEPFFLRRKVPIGG
jgi:hypothetical protein